MASADLVGQFASSFRSNLEDQLVERRGKMREAASE